MMTERLFQFQRGRVCCGFAVVDRTVVSAAPYLDFLVGKTLEQAMIHLRAMRGSIREITSVN